MEEEPGREDWGTWLIVRIMPGAALAGLASPLAHRLGGSSLGAMFGLGWFLATLWNGWIERASRRG